MSLVACPDCGGKVSKDARTCPSCGARNPGHLSPWDWLGRMVLAIGAVLLILLGYGCYHLQTNPEARMAADQRRAIRECEGAYERAREDPRNSRGTLAIMYGACESMKVEFRSQWGREP